MSYLAMAKSIETRQEVYRRALNMLWREQDADDAYQTVVCLLDELGVARAVRIQQEESVRWSDHAVHPNT